MSTSFDFDFRFFEDPVLIIFGGEFLTVLLFLIRVSTSFGFCFVKGPAALVLLGDELLTAFPLLGSIRLKKLKSVVF